jgi:aspartate/methionine/tyrosine aminotransferase
MRSIPTTGINLFQLIYILIREYKDKTGEDPLNLSLGNPDGIPPEAIRALKSKYARDPGYDYHTYAEDKNLNQFAESMVAIHGGIEATSYPHLRVLPIAGIKTASALIPLACGLHLPDKKRRSNFRIVSNLPAYDVIGTWGGNYLAAQRTVWPLVSSDNMRLNVTRLKEALQREGTDRADLIFTIRPRNHPPILVTLGSSAILKTGPDISF